MSPSDTQAPLSADLRDALSAALEWIDAVPVETASTLPAMPGFDRDWANSLLEKARRALPSSEPSGAAEGWIFHNPDTGTEWSKSHPVDSGEVPDAINIRRGTASVLKEELLSSWRLAEERLTTPAAPASAPGAGDAELREWVRRALLFIDGPDIAGTELGTEDGKAIVLAGEGYGLLGLAEGDRAALAAHSPSATASGGGER